MAINQQKTIANIPGKPNQCHKLIINFKWWHVIFQKFLVYLTFLIMHEPINYLSMQYFMNTTLL